MKASRSNALLRICGSTQSCTPSSSQAAKIFPGLGQAFSIPWVQRQEATQQQPAQEQQPVQRNRFLGRARKVIARSAVV